MRPTEDSAQFFESTRDAKYPCRIAADRDISRNLWSRLAHSRPFDIDHTRDALVNRRERFAQFVRALLVPVGHCREVVGAVIAMAVLYCHFEVLLERDRRVYMKTIDHPLCAP